MDLHQNPAAPPRPLPPPGSRHAFTVVELIVIILVIALIVGILLPTIGNRHHHGGARPIKCATQVRNIVQSCLIWSQQNQERFPLPSQVDKSDATLASGDNPRCKDTTGNIMSLLIWNGAISPEVCISPAESNSLLVIDDQYHNANPPSASHPAAALWDPGFKATPEDLGGSNGDPNKKGFGSVSYAHALPFGPSRTKRWANTFSATEPVWGNRGPTYAQDDWAPSPPTGGKWNLLPGPLGAKSNTLLIHGGRNTWEGNIGFNDGHVDFETRADPIELTYCRSQKPSRLPDNLFVNESDDQDHPAGATPRQLTGTNAYLRMISAVSGDESDPQVSMFRD